MAQHRPYFPKVIRFARPNLPGVRRASIRLIAILCFCIGLGFPCASAQRDHTTWRDYGGGPDNSKYVALDQITKSNVRNLTVAWSYPTRDANSYSFNPVIVGNVMYLLARGSSLVALDATTGKEIWVHENLPGMAYRGINYWESKDKKDRRLIFQINHYVEEIDASTGKSILTFGDKGLVDLRVGLGRDPNSIARIRNDTPGRIFGNVIVFGSSTGEGYMSPPGDLRAYDVISGKMVWIFHTVPHPGEPGYNTWPKDAWKYIGGTNAWGEITLDEKTGTLYVPTGSATYDMYGGDRIGQDLFANCLLAINARSGKLLWYFQVVHHDLWDYDLTAAPQLITIHPGGKTIEAVAQAGKDGFLYVFDRHTGKPVWPIEERPVPKSDTPGEEAWPTQPFPTLPPPFSRHEFTAEDLDPYLMTDQERAEWKTKFANLGHGFFTPPSVDKDTLQLPGAYGGANWGSTSSNPSKGLVYVMYDDLPSVIPKLSPRPYGLSAAGGGGTTGLAIYQNTCQACHGADRKGVGTAPSLIGIGSQLDQDNFKRLVASGKGDMPAFPALNSSQLDRLFTYLTNQPEANGSVYSGYGPKKELGGPVVGSGGAPGGLLQDYGRAELAAQYPGSYAGPPYPDGVNAPPRLYSEYGMGFPYIVSPPWSGLAAYDLNKGTIQWKIPLGDDPQAATEGAPADTTGLIEGANHRGIIVTSTGLLFVNCADGKLRAFDADNGKVLWSYQLPTGTQGIPAMYEVNGREYLVVGATARQGSGRTSGGGAAPTQTAEELAKRAYITFALPQ
jgi:quinoprotein glucose dehydrogenase